MCFQTALFLTTPAIKVDLEGYYIEPVLVPLSQTGVTETRELLPAEDDEEPEEVVTGYIIAEKVSNGLFKPRWNFALWADYQAALIASREAHDQALADWYAETEEERGERPAYVEPPRPECWVEGMPQEEIDAIRNAPQPVTTEQRVAQLESESVETMLGLAEVYETSLTANTIREQETVETMLGLAEAYEIILIQQATIDALSARVAALEGGES
ncbi:hypothetical protein [Cohnella hongkongensis]|uniref:Bacteriophage SP-beta YorD domain-containing protein n=1 Tax=Cohnella hongkongensis TaxID=178337 RepID=A0ABV9FDC1_9BACL